MDLFRRIFFAAVLAGVLAGLALAAVQQWRVVPLILQAESYEGDVHTHDDGTAHAHEDEATEAEEPWAPADGTERTAYTVLATTLAGLGFTLVIAAVSVLSGVPITANNGVIWGMGGFIAFALAPALGLPPELPGMPAADISARQVWWWGTVLATGAAALGIARFRTPAAIGVCIIIAVIPHLAGAPQPGDAHSEVPAHLASAYAAAALSASLIFWLIAGTLMGWFNDRFGGNAQ